MRTFRDPDEVIRSWLEEGPLAFPDQNERAIDLATQSMSQRRPAMRLPWRYPDMTTLPKVVAIGVAVVAVTLGGALVLGQRTSAPGGVDASPPPSPSSAPSAAPSPSASPAAVDTSQWYAFTSPRYGFTSAYPKQFTLVPSSTFWTIPDEPASGFDYFFGGPGNNNWVGASMRLPDGVTPDAWIETYRQGQIDAAPGESAACHAPPEDWTPVTIDGHTGSLRLGCGALDALVFVDDRVYSFGGWTATSTTPFVNADFRTMFEAWLTTIRLDPASALDPPVASPSPS